MDDSFEPFCEIHFPRLVGLLSLYCGDKLVAEDLAQDALAKACVHWSRVRRMDDPSAWLNRTAFNLVKSRFRRRRLERRAMRRLELIAPGPHSDPDTAAIVAVRKAVAKLPDRQKTVLLLRYFEDMSVDQVSAVLGLPHGTVKSLTRRAIQQLQTDGSLIERKEIPSV